MRALFVLVFAVGAVVIVATPIVAANLLRVWPVSVFYGAGIAIYVAIFWLLIRWRRNRAAHG